MCYAVVEPTSVSVKQSIVHPRWSKMNGIDLNRRDFLKLIGTTGASLLFGIYLNGCDQAGTPKDISDSTKPDQSTHSIEAATVEPNIYLKLDSQGGISVTAFRSEMGQGIRTALAMILAEELDANWDSVVIEQAPADRAYGDQVTGGSASISGSYFELRMAGASVRQLLVNAAAMIWGVNPSRCTTNTGTVIHPNGDQSLSYGDLVATAQKLEIPPLGEYKLKPQSEFRIIGKDIHHWDAPNIITGKAIYGFDVKLPGMLYAAIARPPVFNSTISSFDGSKALEVDGVKSVQVIDNWIAVVADKTWGALKGRETLEVVWEGGQTNLSSDTIRAALAEIAPQPESAPEGVLDAVYEFPYQAHVTMEPMNCVADVQDDACHIWAPTQSAQDVQRVVQSALSLPSSAVTVNVTLMGGGFGRRLQTDYAVEAAKLSRSLGAPVQVVWTRKDDIRHDFYHPYYYIYTRGDLQEPNIPRVRPFDGSNFIPTGAWRSVGNHPDAYARESFIDELAWAQGLDPLEYRRRIYTGRALAVIDLAASKAGWGEPLPDGWGRGIAYHATFGVTHVAMVAKVEVNSEGIRVHKVFCAVDCGTAINPGNIAAQMEGGIAFGLTAALKAGIMVDQGRILESNFNDCPILQINEMPQVEVHIINSEADPSGIGEMGVPPIAPAIANAVFSATGIRVRHLPIKIEDLK
jgi:isoquinoline 1-oxidoreductase beta subunit